MKRRAIAAVVVALVVCAPAAAQERVDSPSAADIVLRNGRIFVADDATTVVSALAVKGERIVAAGADADVSALIGPGTRVVDLRGGLVTPGMNDAHLHFATGGMSLLEARLLGTTSVAQIAQRVR